MAGLQERNGSYRIIFRYHGKQHAFTLGQIPQREAENWSAAVDQILLRIEQKFLHVPPGTDIVAFIRNGGKVPEPTVAAEQARHPTTLVQLREKYVETHGAGAMETNSLATAVMHLKHFEATLGPNFPAQDLTLADLQRHVTRRRQKQYRGSPLSPTTLKKEVASFRACWNWGVQMGLVKGLFPARGLVYPKADEKLPYMTRQEIERRLTSKMTEDEVAELWECLYLRADELTAVLSMVQVKAAHGWIYPFFCFAAHTGARRSEILRVKVADVDFEGRAILIHEKKRSRKQRTTRRVPLTPFLANTLKEWLKEHPGGSYLFCHQGEVTRSKKRSKTTGHQNEDVRPSGLKGRLATVRERQQPDLGALTRDEVHDHLRRTLAGSTWQMIRGLHTLRHSYISCLASAGVDQRIIDEAVGHQTEEQRKRYRHLYPNVVQDAIGRAFEGKKEPGGKAARP